MKIQTTYACGEICGGIQFGLYPNEDANVEKSMMMIESGFRNEFEKRINERLKKFSMEIEKWKYTSPKYYNYSNDSLNLTIKFYDPLWRKYNKFILENEKEINEKLDKNKNYDGYIALTIESVAREIEEQAEKNYAPDPIIMNYILTSKIDFTEFDVMEYIIWDENECPNEGDSRDDCEGCIYSGDYHCVDGECVRRDEENVDKETGEYDPKD